MSPDEMPDSPDAAADAPAEPQEGDYVIAAWIGPEGLHGWDMPDGASKTFTAGDLIVISHGQAYGSETPLGDVDERTGRFVPHRGAAGEPQVLRSPPDPKYRALTKAEAAAVTDRSVLWRWNRGRLIDE